MMHKCYNCQDGDVSISISGQKKWLNLDVSSTLDRKSLSDSGIRVAKLSFDSIRGPMDVYGLPDLIQVPCGDCIDFVVGPSGGAKRQRGSDRAALLLSTEPFRLVEFSRKVRKAIPDCTIEFVNSDGGKRVLSIKKSGLEVVVANGSDQGECPVINIMGQPSEIFYSVRKVLYESTTSL